MSKAKARVWKKDEFRDFIRILKEGQIKYWKTIAESLGVQEETISYWKTLPEAQDAMTLGIVHALENMETSGKKDWRMWQETAKVLSIGLNPPKKIEGELKVDDRQKILRKYGLGEDDAGETEETEGRSFKDPT